MDLINTGLKRLYHNEKGATSVLVVLMVLVLVSLGYFSLASANSNIKLGNNAIEWNKKYYRLDGSGEAYLADVDNALYKAQLLAQEYVDDKSYEQLTHKNLPVEFHSILYYGFKNTPDVEWFLEAVLNRVYLYYANIELNALSEKYSGNIVSALETNHTIMAIICDLTLTDEEAADFHLDISITVNPLSDFISAQNDGNYYYERYSVISWAQWQTIVESTEKSTDGIGVWDGVIVP